MKTYVLVTSAVFALIALSHVWRLVEEGFAPARDPWFVVTSVLSVSICIWAWWLLRRAPR